MTLPKVIKFLGEIMMNKQKLLQEAEYADIILTLLNSPYAITSITKLIFIAFCVRYESNISAYKNRSKDFIDVFFKNISLKLSAHYDDIEPVSYTHLEKIFILSVFLIPRAQPYKQGRKNTKPKTEPEKSGSFFRQRCV